MEYCNGGDLEKILNKNSQIPQEVYYYYFIFLKNHHYHHQQQQQ
jgi:hypothetical protein